MKHGIATLLLCTICFASFGQKINPNYDSVLAKTFAGDDYGMKQYVLVILKTGTNTTTDKKLTDSLFTGHMNNIMHLVKINKLVVSGPVSKNEKTYRGIFILNVSTFEEAEKLLDKDPAIKQKLLAAELYSWYGSAALPAYLDASEKIRKLEF